jgi:hypothetical protein
VPADDSDFEGTPAKSLLRRNWDLPILERAFSEKGRPLTYFGLPGPRILDLLDWRPVLGTATGAERLRESGDHRRADLERHRRLLNNILVHGFDGFQLLRGNVEDVICDAADADGTIPKLNDGAPPHRMRFKYDIVNLDFYGGVAYPSPSGEHVRVRAIRKLLERQQGTDFLLFLTINVRDKVNRELTQYLTNTGTRVDSQTQQALEWYARRGTGEKDYKLKAAVSLFVHREAEGKMFSCHCYPVVSYDGNDARMVHFAFSLKSISGNFQAFSEQKLSDIVALPLVKLQTDRFIMPHKQHHGFDSVRCSGAFDFLPDEVRRPLLQALESWGQKG